MKATLASSAEEREQQERWSSIALERRLALTSQDANSSLEAHRRASREQQHRWAEIGSEIHGALIRSQQVALLQIGVHVDPNGVHLVGQVYTRREYELTERIAQQHSNGLSVNNEIRISAETASRLNK